ncbi:hypothetical protein N665_2425s0002 [Sinapis alba]|nr:hypothetical protein N665_2425s0002 [Sinapis alba]
MVSSHLLLHGASTSIKRMGNGSLFLAVLILFDVPSPWSLVSASLQWKPSSVMNRLDFFSPAM